MSEPVVEIAYLPLVPGTDTSTGEGKRVMEDTLKTLLEQPGCTAVYHGRQVEHPDMYQLAIEWTTLQAHKDFEQKPYYGAFLENLGPIAGGTPFTYHIKISSDSPFADAAGAPVTEHLNFYFSPDRDEAAYLGNFVEFEKEARKAGCTAVSIVGGWGIETHEHEGLGKDGEKGTAKVFGAFVGWKSIDDHMKFREFPTFQDLMKIANEGVKGKAMHHVKFTKA